MVLLVPPVGVILLWKSPATKMSGRIVWSTIFAIMMLSFFAGSDEAAKSTEPTKSVASAPATTKAPEPPKDEYPFKVNNKDNGKTYKGKFASGVGVAILDVSTATTIGTNQFAKVNASSGAMFVIAHVFVSNRQKDAIVMDNAWFKLLANGREYSYSGEADMALTVDNKETLFLKRINPDLSAVGYIAFEVPDTLDLANAQLKFSGGFTGKSEVLPISPITE
jgi:hypothetical protein